MIALLSRSTLFHFFTDIPVLRSSGLPANSVTTTWAPSLIAMAAGLLVVLGMFSGTWQAMARVWMVSETFGHGVLVAPISLWLVWRQREQLAQIQPRASWWGILLLALSCFGWLVAELAGINVVAQAAVTAMIPSLVLAICGWTVVWSIVFPLAFLFFMVPAGEALNPPLMEGTADAVVWAVGASGIPIFRDGLHFALPTGQWSVVEACSGLRYVLASAVLGSLFAYLNFTSFRKRAIFFASTMLLALVGNWMRAYLIVLVGHFSQMKYGTGDDHVVYGWVFFGLVMFAVFVLGSRWRDDDSVPQTGAVAGKGDSNGLPFRASPRSASVWPVLISAILIVALTQFGLRDLRNVEVRPDFAARASAAIGPFTPGKLSMQPSFAGARASLQGVIDPALGTEFYLAYFANQTEGHEMIAYGNAVISDQDKAWQTLSWVDRTVRIDGRELPFREWVVWRGNEQRLVWSWYAVSGSFTRSEYKVKALTAWAMLRGAGDHSTVMVLSTRLPEREFGPMTNAELPGVIDARERLARELSESEIISKLESGFIR
jgi:exosortase A